MGESPSALGNTSMLIVQKFICMYSKWNIYSSNSLGDCFELYNPSSEDGTDVSGFNAVESPPSNLCRTSFMPRWITG